MVERARRGEGEWLVARWAGTAGWDGWLPDWLTLP